MSNYPLGAENDSNAPYNKKEESLQGETIGLFEYLENLEMPYEVRIELNSFITNHQVALMMTNGNNDKFILTLNRLLQEPQIFIENE
jgi:hypothetical protein